MGKAQVLQSITSVPRCFAGVLPSCFTAGLFTVEFLKRLYDYTATLIIPVILLCIFGFVNKAKDEVHIVIFCRLGKLDNIQLLESVNGNMAISVVVVS